MSTARPIAGWYRDPSGQHALRYWDGGAWTPRVRDDTTGLRPASAAVAPAPAPVEAPAPAAATTGSQSSRWPVPVRVLIVAGAVLMAVGAALPWREAHVGNVSVSTHGIDGDGALAVVLGACIVILLVVMEHSHRLAGLVIALAVGAAGFAVYEIVDINRQADELVSHSGARRITAGVGAGPWVTLVGAGVVLLGAVLALTWTPRPRDARTTLV